MKVNEDGRSDVFPTEVAALYNGFPSPVDCQGD
jgi:hypothetical protein